MLGTLTVRENLQFSAALRLPSHTTLKQRRERVEKVIKELGLQSCAGTKVNTNKADWTCGFFIIYLARGQFEGPPES